MKNAQFWIDTLKLRKHPEGGGFRQVYASEEFIESGHLPGRFSTRRRHATSIYYLLVSGEFSALHRIKSDETWHFYEGSALTVHMISPDGVYSKITLGRNPERGEVFQFTVPHGTWFGASVNDDDSFSLVGCTVAPGFDYDDFELGARAELLKMFAEHEEMIIEMTRE